MDEWSYGWMDGQMDGGMGVRLIVDWINWQQQQGSKNEVWFVGMTKKTLEFLEQENHWEKKNLESC